MKNTILIGKIICLLLLSCPLVSQENNSQNISKLSKKLGITIMPDSKNISLFEESANWLGTRYRRGGNTKSGVDCSGFTGNIYQSVFNQKLKRRSSDIATNVIENVKKDELKTGDLVFFSTGKKRRINHVGIYLKENKFIHASCGKGVIVSSLDESYYKRTWRKGGRMTNDVDTEMLFLPIPELKNNVLLLNLPELNLLSIKNITDKTLK